MNLTQFFRLITQVLFGQNISSFDNGKFIQLGKYDDTYFFCPKIYCNNGFFVSLQINKGNYCSSENGYRNFGTEWKDVEFGFTSIHEELFSPYSENPDDTTKSVGNVPIEICEQVIAKHGGINWDKTTYLKPKD